MKVTRIDIGRNIAGSTNRPIGETIKEWVADLYWLDPGILPENRKVDIDLEEGEFVRYEKAFSDDIERFEKLLDAKVSEMTDEEAQDFHISEKSQWTFLPGIAYVKVKLI